jgi:hypothetical protein
MPLIWTVLWLVTVIGVWTTIIYISYKDKDF